MWTPVAPAADALTAELEEGLHHDFDSAAVAAGAAGLRRMADSLRNLNDNEKADILKARALYWQSSIYYMTDENSLLRQTIDSAAALIAGKPASYDRARITETKSLTMPHDTVRARIYGECLQEYKAAGDSFHLSVMYGRIGAMMSAMSNLREGREYLKKARQMARPGSRQDFITGFNILVNLQDMKNQGIATDNDIEEDSAMTYALKNNEMFATRPGKVRAQIYRALYDIDGDKAWLDSALAVSTGLYHLAAMSWLGSHYVKTGTRDKARQCADSVLTALHDNYDEIYYSSAFDTITAFLRDYYLCIGMEDESRHYGELYTSFVSRDPKMANDLVATANTFKQNELKMAHIEFGKKRMAHRRVGWLWAGIGFVILLIAVSGIILLWRKSRRREEQQTDIDTVRQQVHELLHEVSEGNADEESWRNFSLLFSNAHPGFITALTSQYPELTKGEVRMACYILAGMETKQIAQMLNINPSSVAKNRHRLRSKLRLEPGQDIETFLRDIY